MSMIRKHWNSCQLTVLVLLNSRWPNNSLTFVAGDFDRLRDLTQFKMIFFGEKFGITILLHRIPSFTRDEARLIGYSG